MSDWAHIARAIGDATGASFVLERKESVSGGDINAAWRIEGGGRAFFVKVNAPGRLPMFEAEAAGLAEIARTGTVRVPQPVCWGAGSDASWLALEYIELRPARGGSMRELGRRLALLHKVGHERFGWNRDNTIGAARRRR
jgi:fructosamine-3-kinase